MVPWFWFSVLSETASVIYKVDQLYNKESERESVMMILLLGLAVKSRKLLFLKKRFDIAGFNEVIGSFKLFG
jgi:hypothetical protein